MAESDWTLFGGSLGGGLVDHQVSMGFTPPDGGGTWVYGFHSLQSDVGAVARYKSSEAADFAPMAKGGVITGALKRGNYVDCAPFLVMSAQGTSVSNTAYLLGFAHDENPARLIVVKGRLDQGLPLAQAIVQSTGTYDVNTWQHVRLDVIAQPTDDVKIIVWENDIDENGVDSPDWVKVPGMEGFIDDAIRSATGSDPLIGGYGGFGYYTKAIGREAWVDYLTLERQL